MTPSRDRRGIEGESPAGWFGGSRIFPHDPRSLGGHLNQPPPSGQLPPTKAPGGSCQQLAVDAGWHRDPVLLGVIQPGCSPEARELGRREGLGLLNQKLQAEREKGPGAEGMGAPLAGADVLPIVSPSWAQDCHRGCHRAGGGEDGVPTGTPATASHPTESA